MWPSNERRTGRSRGCTIVSIRLGPNDERLKARSKTPGLFSYFLERMAAEMMCGRCLGIVVRGLQERNYPQQEIQNRERCQRLQLHSVREIMGPRLLGTDKEEAFQFARSYTSSNLNKQSSGQQSTTSNTLDQRHHETCGTPSYRSCGFGVGDLDRI